MCLLFLLQICIFTHLATVSDCQAESSQAYECQFPRCQCCNVGACSSDGQCGDRCMDGYHGKKCLNRCPDNCISCVDAQYGVGVSNCTQCQGGYYSTPTKYQCQLSCQTGCNACDSATHCTYCTEGYYLSESKECIKCHDGCLICNSAASCSSCKTGYYLGEDDRICSKCNPLCSTCTSYELCKCSNGCQNDQCVDASSECTFGCKRNFTSDGIHTCDSCIDGLYGYRCNATCNENCESTCDRTSGACKACRPGLFGQFCGRQCPVAFNCRTCDVSGNCTSCNDGYYMTTLNQCAKCNDTCIACDSATVCRSCKIGYYLDKDEGKCHNCGPMCGMCTSYDTCTCSNGCSICTRHYYCTRGCKTNYRHGPLGQCFSCKDGQYGYFCNESCSENCDKTCNRISGTCDRCTPRFRGKYCDECNAGYYGNDCTLECRTNCKECTMTDGLCEICKDGFFGEFCEENCSVHCLIRKCNKANGGCVCSSDYDGEICQNTVKVIYSSHTGRYIGTAAGVVVAMLGLFAAGILIYRRRKRTIQGVHNPTFDTSVPENDEDNLEQTIAKLDGQISTLKQESDNAKGQRAELQTRLEELRDRTRYANEDHSYEMLQLPDTDASSHYSTLKP